jgi:large subunit ribosomal protein L18
MDKKQQRLRRAARTRRAIHSQRKFRLTVFRSPVHIYAQIISVEGAVLAAASSLDKQLRGQKVENGKVGMASLVGKLLAERAVAGGVTKVAFDRSGYKYHGRVAALAEAARAQGLVF